MITLMALSRFIAMEANYEEERNKNEFANSVLKKINRSLTLGARGLLNPVHAGAGPFRESSGAGQCPFQGTNFTCINPAGTIIGIYADASNAFHGFVRDKHGAVTTFD